MPDEPQDPRNLPGRHRPRLSDLAKTTTEEDLWNLDEEASKSPADQAAEARSGSDARKTEADPPASPAETIPAAKEPKTKPSQPSVTRRDTKRDPSRVIKGDIAGDEGPRPEPMKAARPNGPKRFDPKSTTESPPDADPEPPQPAQPAQPATEKPSETPEKKQTQAPPSPGYGSIGKNEKIGLISLGIIFLGLAIWWIVSLFSSIATTRIGDDQPEFPIKGTYITINNAKTYWREPVREGALKDVAKSEVEFIPVLNITISDSESGVLRAIFKNEQGDYIGDSIPRAFANGVFDLSGDPTEEFPATDGFTDSSQYNGYRIAEERWTVEVFEGPSSNAAGSDFKLLFTAPISSKRQ